MPSLVIHGGVPRSGSTLLQEVLFPELPGINFLGKTRHFYPEWLIRWHYSSDDEFARAAEEIRSEVETSMRPDQVNVLSSEMFAMWGGDPGRQAARVHRLFPDARLVFVLRHPRQRLESLYKSLVLKNQYTEPLKDLIDWKEFPFVFYKRKPICVADFRYDDLIAAYRRWFPESSVRVLKMEALIQSPLTFLRELCEKMAVEVPNGEIFDRLCQNLQSRVNATPSKKEIQSLRLRNLREKLAALGVDVKRDELTLPEPTEDVLPDAVLDQFEQAIRGRCCGYV